MKMERGRQPTLGDVAARADVSKQTISRVINNKEGVAEPTRQRVLEAIRELGYQPNALARSLVTSKTLVIGLSVPNIDQPFFPQIAKGVEDAAAENGYSVFLCNASGSHERELQAIERLRGHRVAGIISFNSRLSDATLERAIGGLFPVVMINREVSDSPGTVIWPGYETGARLATEHLIRLGRRRIMYLGLDIGSNVDNAKYSGYTLALEQSGLPIDSDLVVRADRRIGRGFNDLLLGGESAIRETLEDRVKFDAVFASNDLPAIGALRYLISQGCTIPEDIAIVGFGDANVAGIVSPPLSTVTMPLYEMGSTAFYALLDQINRSDHVPRQVTSPPQLIIRESSVSSEATFLDRLEPVQDIVG